MTGVKEWMIWLCWFLYAFPVTFITITLLVYVVVSSIFNYVPLTIVWGLVILFSMAHITFCFLIASIFEQNTVATMIYVLSCMVGIIVKFYDYIFDHYAPFIKYLYPLSNCYMGAKTIFDIESTDIPYSWTAFIFSDSPLFFIFCMLFLNIWMYMLLAYYIANINPGKFGIRKSPFFFVEEFLSKHEDLGISSDSQENNTDSRFFEAPPANLKAVLRIVDLQKYFKSFHAVKGVNLNTYNGEITVLLGHNGAGKTVTMSMITGLIAPSSGAIYYEDNNIIENMEEFRSQVGFCPQENRTFPYLSVMNHLLFFGQLKGLSLHEAALEAGDYLHMIGMDARMNAQVKDLSGGMKRKLCLSMAMMGKVKILILDEPTSGMDAESRRSLWSILLTLRGTRSMILTTHYMSEADVLGDRIAIMNHGIIVCHGTSMFLKKAYDSGYELRVSKSGDSKAITQLVQQSLPSALVVSDAPQEIVYKLPLTEVPRYPALFRSLESSMPQLDIESMGVTATTMDQVSLKTGGAIVYDPKSPAMLPSDANYSKIVGFPLFSQQIWAMLKKKFLYTLRDRANVFTKIILSTLLILYVLYMMEGIENPDMFPSDPIDLSLSLYPEGQVLYQEMTPFNSLQKHIEGFVKEKKGDLVNGDGSDMTKKLISYASTNYQSFASHFVSAIQVNGTVSKLMGSNLLPSSLPITIDTYTNVLLRAMTGTDKYSIETTGHPVAFKNHTIGGFQCYKASQTFSHGIIWYTVLGILTNDFMIYFSWFVSMEHTNGFYHIQMMSRLSPAIYWLGTFLFDYTFFMIIIIVRLTLFKIVNGYALFIGFLEEFYILLLLLILYGIGGLLMIYTLTSLVPSQDSSSKFFNVANVMSANFMLIYKVIYIFIQMSGGNVGIVWQVILNTVWVFTFIIPSFTFYLAFLNWMVNFYINKQCLFCVGHYKEVCEAQLKKQSNWYFTSHKNESGSIEVEGLLTQILLLILQIPMYSLILFLIHSGSFGRLYNLLEQQISGLSYKSSSRHKGDDDVQREHERVQQIKNSVARQKEGQKVTLLVDRLRKNYLTPRVFTAVSDLSFVVERGTCFGLLGVNGAGKTTTFKMLTAEIIPTLGDAYVNGIKLSENKQQYLSAAGYCSQTNCIIEQLTGAEMLKIIASIKGVPLENKNELVDKWISVVGLDEYKDRKCGTYSGGNKRKLCSAMALIGNPKVVFLDEPTTGVDPVSRRSMYDVMGQSRASGQTVVITSHDIDECETLCDRLTIMVAGVMKCLGTVQYLKKRYAQGFSALVKIVDSGGGKKKVPELKQAIEETFSSGIFLKDEHLDVLYYQISDTSLPWSTMFENMESIKSQFPDVVQDYVLTDMPLEEVFISFAKEQR